MLELRKKTIEKQEKRITSRLEELQTNLQTAMQQMQQ
jgi:prefoldin beta subunit